MAENICGKTLEQWRASVPILNDMMALKECLWLNPAFKDSEEARAGAAFSINDVYDAEARLRRFAPLLAKAFPETAEAGGVIESELKELHAYKNALYKAGGQAFSGRMLVKCDSHLPVSGSIKARGGIYEVLCYAERLAFETGSFFVEDDYSVLLTEPYRALFSRDDLVAGSTGNLGLSIGIMGARLGFHTTIHMSSDARQWKKELLRARGAFVVEHAGDFSSAIQAGRKSVGANGHFVDDENSKDLFLGYAVAALRLQKQLDEKGVRIDEEHPLFVYLPCGVGGGPGGVAFGLKLLYGNAAHCFFAEPTHAPCMLLGLATGCHDGVSVQDFGIDNKTAADGLAVGRASSLVGRLIEPFLSGCYTVADAHLFERLRLLADAEDLWLEPSALAGFFGPDRLWGGGQGQKYLARFSPAALENATHIAWATGGGMVPAEMMRGYYDMGKTSGIHGKNM